jgi:cytochrome c-type biogenesis protein CcmH/NrfG
VWIVEDNLADHPHRPLLVAAYRQFRAGQPRAARDLLKPVLANDELANRPSVMAGVLWGLAGDCYFLLHEADKGFQAYKRAIELDGDTGCLALFACQVAHHRRAEDAEAVLRCLRAARAGDWRALR